MIELTVNDVKKSVAVAPDMPLLWVLRDELGITSPKYGCGIAQCGACTVYVNGMPVRSCQARIGDLKGAKVITLEAAKGASIGAVKQAWIEQQVAQCGYCQTGQIMQAAALLDLNKKPSDADIDVAMSGNLCRCGTYVRVRSAIHAAAAKLAGR